MLNDSCGPEEVVEVTLLLRQVPDPALRRALAFAIGAMLRRLVIDEPHPGEDFCPRGLPH